jgi:plastocyanin
MTPRTNRRLTTILHLAPAALLAAGAPVAASAQSLLDRPDAVSGDWVGNSGTLYFHFVHRFTASDAPDRKVSNVPTILLAGGLPMNLLVGWNYASNSNLAPRYPNEHEFFVRWAALRQQNGAPLDIAGQVGYNLAAEGVDGELSLARRQGPVRAIVAGRVLSNPFVSGETRFVLAGGGTLRLGRWVALAGDAATMLEKDDGVEAAWSAGIHLAIPQTPHSLSLHATNINAGTLQGTSRGGDEVRYGFEFTVPLTLSRYFGGGRNAPPAQPAPTPATPGPGAQPVPAAAGELFRARIVSFAYAPARIEVTAGTTVEWRNDDQLAHTVTANDASFSSPLLQPGEVWRHTFATPGTYDFYCTPHPFMKGVVVVR